ncbi:MAG: peptidylprolyl isomerase [Planctomycetota bacterium]
MSTYKDKVAVIDTSKGRIIMKFYPKEAPNTVNNFVSLADQGFYDGLIFHRVIKGFMIQGGCPMGTGAGGPGWQIDAEFNAIKHEAGTVSMARANDPNSAGSQFFICLEKTPHLDGKYTAFGQVIKGMEVVKAIGEVKTGDKDRPADEVKIFKIRVMDKDAAEKLGAE